MATPFLLLGLLSPAILSELLSDTEVVVVCFFQYYCCTQVWTLLQMYVRNFIKTFHHHDYLVAVYLHPVVTMLNWTSDVMNHDYLLDRGCT